MMREVLSWIVGGTIAFVVATLLVKEHAREMYDADSVHARIIDRLEAVEKKCQ